MSIGESRLERVKPVQPIAAWRGGKRHLAKLIAAQIEAVPHDCYAEPFVGMGGVFLRRTKKPKAEAINDANGDLMNLFRVVKEHPDELARQFDWLLSSHGEFRRLLKVPPDTLTDVQRAARFAILQKTSFGGKSIMKSAHYAPTPGGRSRLDAAGMIHRLRAVHGRLQGVNVECRDWADFIATYDRPYTLFYLDPPYFGFTDDYGKGMFAPEDFERMARLLDGLKGRFILSLNDRPKVRETFAAFDIEEVRTTWQTAGRNKKKVGELLISG